MKIDPWLCIAAIGLFSGGLRAATFFHVDSYHGRSENPFWNNVEIETAYLEDFEEGNLSMPPYNYLTTPNAQGWNGGRRGSANSGVREDYSAQDGNIGFYWSNASGSSATEKAPAGIHFDFSPDAQGRLPEYVGAALRGMLGTSADFNLILAFDSNGVEVTMGQWQIPKPVPSLPTEDRFTNFEGIYVPGGISRIHFRDFLEVDHLTYGYAIPEPSAVGLAMGSVFWLMRRQRTCGLWM